MFCVPGVVAPLPWISTQDADGECPPGRMMHVIQYLLEIIISVGIPCFLERRSIDKCSIVGASGFGVSMITAEVRSPYDLVSSLLGVTSDWI